MDIVELLSLYLSGEGYRILSAVDGQQALTLMETQKVDLAMPAPFWVSAAPQRMPAGLWCFTVLPGHWSLCFLL